MADTMAPILDMQNKQDDSKIKSQNASDKTANNKKGFDLSDDARQEKKDQKDFKKSKNTDKASSKSKGSFSENKDSNQASKGSGKGSKQADSGKAKGGFNEEGSNTLQQLSKDARESADDAGQWLKEKGNVALETTKDIAQAVVEKGNEWLGNDNSQKQSNDDSSRQPGEFKQETGEWFNEKCNQVVEKTKDVAQSAIDMGKEWLGDSNQSDKDDKSFNKDENKKNTNKGDSNQQTGEWLKEKGNEIAEKSKETAKAALDKGQEMLDESNKSSKDTKKEGSDKKKKSGEGKKKQAVNPGPMMFKDNTSVVEPPSDNQRSMKENTKELPSVRTAATVGKGKETPQERLQTGKGQFKHDKQAGKHDREQIASSIVTNVHEFSAEATQINEKDEDKQFFADSRKESTKEGKKGSSEGDKHQKQSEKSNNEEKETKKNEDDIPRGSISKKRGNLEESGEWKELLNDNDRTFTLDKPQASEHKETPNTEDHLQSLISDLDKSQQEYSEERRKHVEMAQDPELSAFERIKAAGMALAEGAMELTEAGRKKIAEMYATPSVTVDEDEFKGQKKDESS